jgi:hypothetical protein
VHVTATIHVQAPLTIADGETVQLDPGVSIIVDNTGSLTSQGAVMGVLVTAFNGVSGGMSGIEAQSGSMLSLTNTTVSDGGNSSGGPAANPAQLTCLSCNLTVAGSTISNGSDSGLDAFTNNFQISGSSFNNNHLDCADLTQNIGGTGGTSFNFVFEGNNLPATAATPA